MLKTFVFNFYWNNGGSDSFGGLYVTWDESNTTVIERECGIHEYKCSGRVVFNAMEINGKLWVTNFNIEPAVSFSSGDVIFAEYGHTKKIEDLEISDEEKLYLALLHSYRETLHDYNTYKRF